MPIREPEWLCEVVFVVDEFLTAEECEEYVAYTEDVVLFEDPHARFTPEVVRSRATPLMWRFHDVLPVDDPADAVSL